MEKILAEGHHGHGALPLRKDRRDKKYKKVARASVPFDWNLGYNAEKSSSPTKNQGTSGSCGGQAGSYLEALTKPVFSERSARYIYSQIYYPGEGTTLRDILNFLVKKGSASEALVTSYQVGNPPSEQFMEDRSSNFTGDASASVYEASGYAFVAPDIESYAQAIRDNGGAIMELRGQNNGTWESAQPIPPNNKTNLWAHFLVCTGAMMRNGKKVIRVHNSWGDVGEGGYQYISEDYFKSGNVLQGGVIYPKDSPLVLQQKLSITEQLIALYQQLINILTGKATKIVL